ncbi:MAG: hypothetical protein ACL93V_15445 [Candidatus Electrothrix sp. YB6]
MKKVKLFFAAALVGGTMIMGAGSAEAGVSASGTIRVTQVRPGDNYHYIYFTYDSVLPSFIYYCRTYDDTLIQAAEDAMENHLQVKFYCDGTSWTSGAFRYGGEIETMYNYSF